MKPAGIEYWEKQWADRIRPDGVYRNQKKARVICSELWNRPHYIPLKKFEVGCGCGEHIIIMSQYAKEWRNWKGIDLSESAIKYATDYGLNAEVANLYEYEDHNKYQLFLFLDTLEHLEHHDMVAEKIRSLRDDEFYIFGNVPLYLSAHEEGYERNIDINVILEFLQNCGCEKQWNHIYGVNGYPYMMFEGYR